MGHLTLHDEAGGNPRAASTRLKSANSKILTGQINHDLRRGPQPGYVAAERSYLNRILIEPTRPAEMRRISNERRARRDPQRAMKKSAAIATRGIITFGSEAAQMFGQLSADRQDAAFRELAQAIADRLDTSLHGLVVHLDESTIHAHYELAGYDRSGQPISQSTSPKVLSELQDLTAEVMARHCPGIERGRKYGERLAAGAGWSDVINKSVRQLHRELPRDIEAKRVRLQELTATEAEASARVDEMRARVERLNEKGHHTVKELKRLQTYEKRLADRLAELTAAQAASEAARDEADRLEQLARRNADEAMRKAEAVTVKTAAVHEAVRALADEVVAGTIRRTEEGKIKAAAPERLKPGYPEVGLAVIAAADLGSAMQDQRIAIEADRRDLEADQRELVTRQMRLAADQEEVDGLRAKLRRALGAVLTLLKRPDLTIQARADARDLVRAVKPLADPFSDSAKQSRQETGPGL